MATTQSVTSTYAGEFAGKYIASALLSGNTLGKQAITLKPNVKYKSVVKKLSNTGIVKDATCDWAATGSLALTERILTPKELQVNEALCKDDFRADWEAISMGYSAHDNLPPTFSEFLISHMISSVGAATETSIWQGASGTDGEFGGFTPLFQADSDVVDVDNGGTAVDSSNVISALSSVYEAIPDTIYGADDLVIYASPNVVRAYMIALGGFGANGLGAAGFMSQGTVGEKPLNYSGIPIFMANGLPSSEIVIAQKSNLWFGTGLMSDQNLVKVLDMADLDGSQNVRFVMRYTAGVQYGIGSEIVYYWNSTP
jgi:hypothetical protein